jgi:cytochrome P450
MFVLGVLVLLAALLAVYKFFIKPFKNMKWQAKSFRDKGYKVLEMPFSIIDPPPMMVYDKSGKFEDSLEFVKNNYPKYDVVVMNLLNEVLVELVNPDLVKSFLAPDKLNTYPKDRKYVDVMERAIGKGIAFSEGHEWKKKRKVLSEIFNF